MVPTPAGVFLSDLQHDRGPAQQCLSRRGLPRVGSLLPTTVPAQRHTCGVGPMSWALREPSIKLSRCSHSAVVRAPPPTFRHSLVHLLKQFRVRGGRAHLRFLVWSCPGGQLCRSPSLLYCGRPSHRKSRTCVPILTRPAADDLRDPTSSVAPNGASSSPSVSRTRLDSSLDLECLPLLWMCNVFVVVV